MHLPIDNPVMILVACAIFTIVFMLIFARKYLVVAELCGEVLIRTTAASLILLMSW